MREVFREMQFRMRNYAFHHLDRINSRTLVALQNLDLFENTDEARIGANIDLAVLQNPEHPRRLELPSGPLLLYLTENEKPKRMIVEVPVLIFSELPEVRKAALVHLERMIADGSLAVTPKTKTVLENSRDSLSSDQPQEWRPAAIALSDAFYDDILVALQGARQSLASVPVAQESLNTYAPCVLHPAISSLDSVVLDIHNPETEHGKLAEIVASVVEKATSVRQACEQYYARLGFLPLAPPYGMAEVVARWMATHPNAHAWSDVWDWVRATSGPIPHYHACSVFVLHPELIPEGSIPDLWREIIAILRDSDRKGADRMEHEPWELRRDLARHFAYHLEARLPDNDGGNISCFAWWLAERVASLFPDDQKSAQFYRKNWVEPAANLSAHVWLAASPHIGISFLRYMTATITAPWATALLSLMAIKLDQLAPGEQPPEIQVLFHNALVSCMVGSLPVAIELPSKPTFAQEYPLGQTARKWMAYEAEDQRKAFEQLVATSQTLGSVENLCASLGKLNELPIGDQTAVVIALKAKAYTDPRGASEAWEVLSDSDWRQRVLESMDERVLGLLIEAFSILQIQNQDKKASLLPHYIADLCEKAEDEERRRQLFLYVLHSSQATDSVSAVHRLMRGNQKALFIELASNYRHQVEGSWAQYPAWVQSRLRGLLANLNTA